MIVPEALSLQWGLLRLCTTWDGQAWLRQYEAQMNPLVASISCSEHHAHVSDLSPFPGMYNQQKTREHKSNQPSGINKLCISILNLFFACAVIHVSRSATTVTCKTFAFNVMLPWKQGRRDKPHSQIIHEKTEADKGAPEARQLPVKQDHAVKDQVSGTLRGSDACFVERFLSPSLLSLGGHL